MSAESFETNKTNPDEGYLELLKSWSEELKKLPPDQVIKVTEWKDTFFDQAPEERHISDWNPLNSTHERMRECTVDQFLHEINVEIATTNLNESTFERGYDSWEVVKK